jgi:hypothetical protein
MNKFHIIVDINNVTAEQAQEFRRLFAWMNYCGMAGCSRSAKVVYDGDGNARARISINGEEVVEPLGTIDGLTFDFD